MAILHTIAFAVTMAMVGFTTMIEELFLALLAYSCYLVLREWLQILYIISLVLSQWNFFFSDASSTTTGGRHKASYQVAGQWTILGMHACAMFWLGFGYWAFRKSGGIWGDKKDSKLERALAGGAGMAGNLAGKVGNKIE